ncbi:MAG: MBL fold metallo-hydrolase [Gemmatimonadota bacterium]
MTLNAFRRRILAASMSLAAVVSVACGDTPDRDGPFEFPERWIDGTDSEEPRFQVHELAAGTWIIRQSLTTHFEAPFLYLLAGDERALLIDTGAPTEPWLRQVVDGLIGEAFPLIVAHSHAHGDHVAGDSEFRSRPNTEIVGHAAEDVARFYRLEGWPQGSANLDLGQRPLLVIPIPGHEPSSIAVFDERTGVLLTGDSLYPGRLYVRDFDAYRASVDRLVETLAGASVSWVLGAHIEMTDQPGVDYEQRQPSHPGERRLQMTWDHLLELQQALSGMGEEAEYTVLDGFIVYPLS